MRAPKSVLRSVVFSFTVFIGMMIGGDAFGFEWFHWLDGARDLTLVSRGRSDYSIYVATNAPDSVKGGAAELQRVVEISTGVKLAITNVPVTPMISLGNNEAARQAGYSSESLPVEAFVIVVKKGNVYIVGNDGRNCSSLTAAGPNGVYEFLERFIGVRWLMPGEIGEDIPRHDSIIVPTGTIRGAPATAWRELAYIQGDGDDALWRKPVGPGVQAWMKRSRLGGTLLVNGGEEWQYVFTREVLTNLPPEYMALVGGRRVHPDDKPGDQHIKFCTTNPDLIKAFADAVMAKIAKRPWQNFSLSPTDGDGWCECEKCKALDEPCDWEGWKAWHGKEMKKSLTRRMLTFYNAVAQIVGRKYPDKMLCGYAYALYTYPPLKPMKIEPNLFIVVAPLPYYGGSLYCPELQAEFPKLMHDWMILTQGRVGYYDLPTSMMKVDLEIGAPQPPGRSILKCIFPALAKEKVKYIYFYGFGDWGYGALHNYVVARLMWNPEANVDALFEEWLQRAYGKEAAVPMGQLYDLLETEVGNYKRTRERCNCTLPVELVRQMYPKIFPEMERLYGAAMASVKTEPQRARLAMFGDNLVLLHWNLRKANLLKEPEKSIFYRSDEDFHKFAEKTCNTLAVSPTRVPKDKSAVEEFMRPRLFNAEQKKAKIPRRSQDVPAPVIDGGLSDALWKTAAVFEGFTLAGKSKAAGQRTEARAAFDADNLYILFVCREDKRQYIKAACAKRDDTAIYEDDCVEVFLGQAGANGGSCGNNYWHITVNANNAVWDDFLGGPRNSQTLNANLTIKSAVKKNDQDWVVELAIPLKELTFGDPSGKTWRVNLGREEKAHSENSSWNPVEYGFCSPEHFGVWKFE